MSTVIYNIITEIITLEKSNIFEADAFLPLFWLLLFMSLIL